ncbi:MAG: sporulation protein YqfD [Paenibacillaceae bacterium]|uniref:Sporulation protein YqfD n=1 Tax=Paenibacillus mellifer TaxID=2937794 RepID=A0A9X1XZN2_9BACL|nr:sporulation protein YqfD [Paenibacillus mellifer]MBW4838496.1 sporulation protein YqfD [Paenibacillaceae bacterium]MCK8487888.1 sporulation protein YqfD [Paenibacillus mellifer]
MKSPALSQLRGIVTIRVRGGSIEQLVNELSRQGIDIWDVKPLPGGQMDMNVALTDFFRLRPLLKRTGCRMSVRGRSGLPFVLARVWKRKGFIAGFALFVAAIFCLSSLVWDVEVKGNEEIAAHDVLQAAKQEGIYPFQWIFRLPDQDKLSAELTRKLPGTSWVGVTRTGTRITIQVVEATKPKDQQLVSPSHLVSKHDAVITHIYAEKGQPEVGKNDRVKKGQVLVSGFQGGKPVVPQANIRGIVWHEYNIQVPQVYRQKVYTGERKQRGYLYFGNTAIQLTGYGIVTYAQSETMTVQDPLTWRAWKLPIGWMTEKVMETTELELKRTEEQAKQEGIERAKRDILAKYGTDSVIMDQKILHEKADNGKVYIKVHFEVEQNIAEEVPIVHDQGE